MAYPSRFTYTFTVPESVIDDFGHVNNVAYVQWMQDATIRHGQAVGYVSPENSEWFVREHHIEYLNSAYSGEELEVQTWLSEIKRVRAHRQYVFVRKSDGKTVARGDTHWVHIDATTGRPMAIPADLQEWFPVTAS